MLPDTHHICITVNGESSDLEVEGRALLVDVLRDELGLTGAHIGCQEGLCGACTVELDGSTVKSCMVLAASLHGARVTTIESVADGGQLDPVQQAFTECHGLQCGYCTPGMVISTRALIARTTRPSDDEIREALLGNLCRCTGYQQIIRAVKRAGELAEAARDPEAAT